MALMLTSLEKLMLKHTLRQCIGAQLVSIFFFWEEERLSSSALGKGRSRLLCLLPRALKTKAEAARNYWPNSVVKKGDMHVQDDGSGSYQEP